MRFDQARALLSAFEREQVRCVLIGSMAMAAHGLVRATRDVYTDVDAEDMIIDGIRVRVATPQMLYEMKRDTVRPQDRVDADSLRERFGLEAT